MLLCSENVHQRDVSSYVTRLFCRYVIMVNHKFVIVFSVRVAIILTCKEPEERRFGSS